MIKSVRAASNSSFALSAPQVGNPVTVGATVSMNDPLMFTKLTNELISIQEWAT